MAFMAISAERYPNGQSGAKYTYLCESTADIANLPTGSGSAGENTPGPGSLAYIETDSTARYILTIDREWSEYPMSSGGGGGGSTPEIFLATYTYDGETEALTCDKTYAEITAAADAGLPIIGVLVLAEAMVLTMIGSIAADENTVYFVGAMGSGDSGIYHWLITHTSADAISMTDVA